MGIDAFVVLPDLLFLGIPILFLRQVAGIRTKEIPGALGFHRLGRAQAAKKTLVILAALLALALGITLIATLLQVNDLEAVQETIAAIAAEGAGVLAYLLVVRVFAEEVFFRGFLQQKIGVLPAAVFFGLGHALFGSIVEVIGAVLLGFVLGWFMQRNQNILPNLFAHFAYNIIALVVLV